MPVLSTIKYIPARYSVIDSVPPVLQYDCLHLDKMAINWHIAARFRLFHQVSSSSDAQQMIIDDSRAEAILSYSFTLRSSYMHKPVE